MWVERIPWNVPVLYVTIIRVYSGYYRTPFYSTVLWVRFSYLKISGTVNREAGKLVLRSPRIPLPW